MKARTIAQVPGLTITLSGGPHLTEFTSFWMQAVRGFDPSKPSARCLRGPYLRVDGERVPPMNVPTAYSLPVNASAVYIYGKSAAGAAHDVHAALVPALGESVTLPLTRVTDAKRADIVRIASLLEEQEWVFARTMPTNPHEYSPRKTWRDDEDFAFAVAAIRAYGWRQKYGSYRETVFEAGSHFYWSGYLPISSTFWINRKPLASPVQAALVDQTITVENARLLDIPELPDGFAGLDTTITTCPFFRFATSMFGYVAPAFAEKGEE